MAKLQIDGTFMLLLGLGLALQSMPASAQPSPVEPTAEPRAERDGQHDFDWEIGTWKTELKRQLRPLTGSDGWVDYQGKSHVGSEERRVGKDGVSTCRTRLSPFN